jgi:hypothetical protein
MEGSRRVQIIVIITIVWAAVLYAIHYFGDKPVSAQTPVPVEGAGPHFTMHFNHLCCSGCGDPVFQSIKRFTWLGQPKVVKPGAAPQPVDQGLMSQKDANQLAMTPHHPGVTDYGQDVVADVKIGEANQTDFDFVQLRQATREGGLVASTMKLEGIPHFQLLAYLPHMCCGLCQTAVQEAFTGGNGSGAAAAQPMSGQPMTSAVKPEKLDVDLPSQIVTAEYRNQVDVGLFMQTLEQAGFAPQYVHLQVFGS